VNGPQQLTAQQLWLLTGLCVPPWPCCPGGCPAGAAA
jgi:hypothetical protein